MNEFDQATEERIKAEGESRQEEKRRVALAFDKESIKQYIQEVNAIQIPVLNDPNLSIAFNSGLVRIHGALDLINDYIK